MQYLFHLSHLLGFAQVWRLGSSVGSPTPFQGPDFPGDLSSRCLHIDSIRCLFAQVHSVCLKGQSLLVHAGPKAQTVLVLWRLWRRNPMVEGFVVAAPPLVPGDGCLRPALRLLFFAVPFHGTLCCGISVCLGWMSRFCCRSLQVYG